MAMTLRIERKARRLVTKDVITALGRRRPALVYRDLAVSWLLIIFGLLLYALHPAWYTFVITFLIVGTRQYALFLIGHDGMHHNLHPKKTANDLLTQIAIYASLGMSLRGQRENHLAHHMLLGTEKDPDRYLHSAENKNSVARFLFYLTGFATFLRTVHKGVRRGIPRNGASCSDWCFSYLTTMTAQVIVIAGFWSLLGPTYYVALWILPIYVLVFVPDEIRAFCEHAHPVVPDAQADQQRLLTFLSNPIERLFMAPMNMNYHAEHHLWPSVPYYNLPEVRKLLDGTPYLTMRAGYVGFLRDFLRRLPITPRSATESGEGLAQ